MSTGVIPVSCHTERFDGHSFAKKTCAAEVKSGFLVLLRPEKHRQDVRVVVYCTSLEHFAVIYPRKRLSKSMAVVNLKNTSIEKTEMDIGFTVRQKGYDNTVCARFLCCERDMDSWIAAFTSRTSPTSQHHSSLPVLVEAEEN